MKIQTPKFIPKRKESPVTLSFTLYQKIRTNMVEARGIEPLSEKHLHKLSTSVSDGLVFPKLITPPATL